MEEQTIPWGNYVIKTRVVLIVLFLISNFGLSQEEPKEAFGIIALVISQDTIVPDYVKKSIAYRVSIGKMTAQDSISYMEQIRNRKLELREVTSNELAKEILTSMDLVKTGVSKYLTADETLALREKIQPNSVFDKSKINANIDLINGPCEDRCHSFSLPFLVKDNRYLIFHKGYNGLSTKTIEFILYDIDKTGECVLIDKFTILEH